MYSYYSNLKLEALAHYCRALPGLPYRASACAVSFMDGVPVG